jgi:phosphatidylserine decarboxylase
VDFRKPSITPRIAVRAVAAGAAYSALVGLGARAKLPAPLRRTAYRAFARAVGANLDEAELDLAAYDSLGDFFARRLRPGVRTIDPSPNAVIMPCDGVVAARGTAIEGALVQAKGKTYELDELLANRELASRLRGGEYATIYLSPRDYHRVHSPVDGKLVAYEYLPGSLWPVNPRVAERRERLLSRNERVVIEIDAGRFGKVAIVMVGAAGVGNIRLAHASDSVMWRATGERRRIELDKHVARGEELGAFRLGSTVVAVFEPGSIEPITVEVGAPVQFGGRLATARKRNGVA